MSGLDLTHLAKLVARAAEVHGPCQWRMVVTDTEYMDGFAPVCPGDKHLSGAAYEVYDCCDYVIDTHSHRLAELVVALLNQAPAIVAKVPAEMMRLVAEVERLTASRANLAMEQARADAERHRAYGADLEPVREAIAAYVEHAGHRSWACCNAHAVADLMPAVLDKLETQRECATEASAVIARAQDALTTDHPVWFVLDDFDGSMDSVTALVRERDEVRDELRIFRESEALEVVVAEAERNRLRAVLARAKSLGGLIRWCGWPGCLDFYAAHPGPAEQGWTRSKALDVLRCPKHSAAGHQVTWQAYDDDGRPLTDIPITCECGESGVVEDATLGDLTAWWERHVSAVAAAPGVTVSGRTAAQALEAGA